MSEGTLPQMESPAISCAGCGAVDGSPPLATFYIRHGYPLCGQCDTDRSSVARGVMESIIGALGIPQPKDMEHLAQSAFAIADAWMAARG